MTKKKKIFLLILIILLLIVCIFICYRFLSSQKKENEIENKNAYNIENMLSNNFFEGYEITDETTEETEAEYEADL